jgi:glycosyltransferase involved in cell wall biosynthesis
MKPTAIVIPWWGVDLKGGAEQQAYQVATRLAGKGYPIEVLTTCCRSFIEDWSVNHFRKGVKEENGLKIRRFPVDKRNSDSFNQVNQVMLNLSKKELKAGISPLPLSSTEIFVKHNINSTQLIKYLSKNVNNYHAFIFIPYLYGIILNGIPVVARKAFLQPCLHNEVYAYLPQVENIFQQAKGILFNSEGEAELAYKLYGPGIINKSVIVGEGVEANLKESYSPQKFIDFAPEQETYILYLGRRDSTKNIDLLLQSYNLFKQKNPALKLKLVLAGVGDLPVNLLAEGIVDLGLVSEEEKSFLLKHCLALFQPSQNESYSRVIMEAWFHKRPVAVHKNCLATAIAVSRCNGGYLAETQEEWADLFLQFTQIPRGKILDLGEKGYIYAQANANWDNVIKNYEQKLGLLIVQDSKKHDLLPFLKTIQPKSIHQLLPGIAYGDAVSNQAFVIRDYLRDKGFKSDIYANHVDPKISHEVFSLSSNEIPKTAGLIYHQSIGDKLSFNYAVEHPNSKALIYHNITPEYFFANYNPSVAQLLKQGRQELKSLSSYFSISVGDSMYNSLELKEYGFQDPQVLPIIVDPQKWDISPDPELMHTLQDGKKNIIFVGRIAPNKKQDDLVKCFAKYLTIDSNSRLILVGGYDSNDIYYKLLLETIEQLQLSEYVIITGKINNSQLLSYYRTAHLYLSMSEHEGFGVPLVEAMWFDVPILAYKSSAIPETLGKGGLMFTTKEDLFQIAVLAKVLIYDNRLSSKLIKAQRERRSDFLFASIQTKIDSLISKMQNYSEFN